MKKDDDTVDSEPVNDAESEYPSHYYFAEKLIINEILGEMPEVHMPAVAWTIKQRNLIVFLREYISKHQSLPHGCHQLDETKGFGCFDEAIDFDAVRQKILDNMENKYNLNRKAWDEGKVKSVFRVKGKYGR